VTKLSLDVGNTPMEDAPALAEWCGVDQLLVKREDQNPTGSHKDRGAVEQVKRCVAERRRVAVISSSGNAALAAATYARPEDITVVALISPLTEMARAQQVIDAGARVVVTLKPINYSRQLSRIYRWPDLRPSLSPDALRGFRRLGQELARELENGGALFAYASSGTTFEAVGEVLAEEGRDIALHPVQAGLVNGLSRLFDRPGDGRRSMVGDLGVKTSPRASRVAELVRTSGGEAWWAADDMITAARAELEGQQYHVAAECWAALAGVRLAATTTGVRRACLLLTGRDAGSDHSAVQDRIGPIARDFVEVQDLVRDLR
jgi:threonine synthase